MAVPMVRGIITITLGVILVSGVFLSTVKAQDTSNFTAAELALWGVLGLAGIIGIVYGTFAVFGLA
jgi:succinate dehydrogenase hydrophobic anchor subunit